MTYDEESTLYMFVQEIQEAEEGYAAVYAVLFETVLKRGKLISLRSRAGSGSTSITFPDEWEPTNVKAYSFVTTKNGKEASDSIYLTIA